MRVRIVMAATLLVVGWWQSSAAHAGSLFYTDRAAWQTAAGTPSFKEDFSSFAVDTPFRTGPVMVNGMTFQQEGFDENFRNQVDVVPLEFTPNSGSASGSLYTNSADGAAPGTQVRVTFTQVNMAFGLESWDATGGEGVALEIYNGTTLIGSQALAGGNGAFLGYVLTAGDMATSLRFRSITLNPGTGGEGFYIDNLEGVSGVPEPTSLTLLAVGTLGMIGYRYRRRAA